MPWSKKTRPIAPGQFWYRETEREEPVVIAVLNHNGLLCAQVPSHVDPVPLTEIEGEWNLNPERDLAEIADAEIFTRDEGEARFRRGACHAGVWIKQEIQRLIGGGASKTEITDRTAQFVEILVDWQNAIGSMPDGNPWEWSADALDAYIARNGPPRQNPSGSGTIPFPHP